VIELKKQITFNGERADDLAIEWLKNLSYCFDIRFIKMKEIKQKYSWQKKVRVVIRYD